MRLEELKCKYEEEKVSKTKLEEDMNKLREYYDDRIHDVEGKHGGHIAPTSQGEPSMIFIAIYYSILLLNLICSNELLLLLLLLLLSLLLLL